MVQHRSYPMELDGGVGAGGWEVVQRFDLLGNAAPRIADEALALLRAPPLPGAAHHVILDTPQLALQIHESCGHPTELDRAFGEEISLAGGSFLTPDRLGRFRYGSRARQPHRRRDHAGRARHLRLGRRRRAGAAHAARRARAVRRLPVLARDRGAPRPAALGRLRARRGVEPHPHHSHGQRVARARPGGPSLDELIADTDDGILMGNNRSWSIDDLRLNFQFGCEIAWEIKTRQAARGSCKNPVYTGITPRFWGGCDAVGGPDAFRLWGFVSCGKGDPMQLMAVGHGCPPARFRSVSVGSGGDDLRGRPPWCAGPCVTESDEEVELWAERSLATRFSGSRVTQSSDVLDVIVQVRVALGGRVGTTQVSSLDPQAIVGAVDRARALAREQPADAKFCGFEDRETTTLSQTPELDAAIVAADPQVCADVVRPAFEYSARAGLTAGLASASQVAFAVATTRGARRTWGSTRCRLDVIASDASTSARSGAYSTRLSQLDGTRIATEAV